MMAKYSAKTQLGTATEIISNLKEFFGVPDLMDIVDASSLKNENVCLDVDAFEQEIDTFQTAEIDIKECFTNSYNHKAEASLKVS